ncbi:hypothetical protein [Tychonema sp. BBK16]|uniref:hypothetical protein n=1 Tax=Tychonema sp. BBK16 TaxID=2699888 RepID=UPI001F27A2E1|nr:hypothetical protein [Tychonema sp. BBK16]MCF6374857.1 hypothetical protein [Tychonema sp. BBK16]
MNLIQNKLSSKIAINGTLLVLLFFITIAVSSIYVSSERTFYWWDYAGYNNATVGLANSFRESPDKAIRGVIESLSNEKNLLISLPLVPFLLLFGDSRLSYVLSVSLIYVVPFRLLLAAISVKLIPVYPHRVFWSTVLFSLLIPMSWIPTLRGYLDTGGCVFVALAILVYLHDVKLKYWWQIPLIGCSLAMAILFRRHFAYSAIAFFGAAILQVFIEFIIISKSGRDTALPSPKSGRDTALPFPKEKDTAVPFPYQFLFESGVKLGLIAITSFTVLMLVAGDFTRSALTVNYRNLYAAWSLPVNDIVTRYANFYGLGTWLLVTIGFSAGILTRMLVPTTAIFVSIFGILSLIEWLLVLRYGYLHYTIHITPIALLGLSAFFWTTWLTFQGKVRYLTLGVAGLYLSINAFLGLIPLKFGLSGIFMGNFPPLVRSDYGEVIKLVEFLRKIAPNEEPIYIAGASNSFNANILKQANRKLNPPEGWWKLNTLGRPLIDSRDTYPLPELLISEYVVVATPFQQVLPSDEQVLRSHEQDVVKVVYDAFTQNWEISQDFQILPENFQLENGVIVRVYRRMRPSAIATTVKTLYAMQQQIGEKPGTQLDWISLNQSVHTSANYSVTKESDHLYNIVTHPIKNTKQLDTSFLYLGSLSAKNLISATLNLPNKQCEGVSLGLTLWNNQGKLINSTETAYNPKASPKLNLLVEGNGPTYLLLEVLSSNKQDLSNQCQLKINNLSISTPKS